MINRIRGPILEKGPSHLVLDVGGVGLLVHIPVSSFDRFGGEGDVTEVVTHLHVREGVLDLYGFADRKERRLFRMLLAVSGIGPRSALGILSGMNVQALQTAILSGDIASLTCVPGIGRKTAQRIVIELKGPLAEGLDDPAVGAIAGGDDKATSAVEALVALGVKRSDAYRSVATVMREAGDEIELEELVKRALAGPAGSTACDNVGDAKSEVRK